MKTQSKNKPISLASLLLPYQKRFITNNKNKKIWLASRQIGKSFSLAFIACYIALQKNNSLCLIISTGQKASNEFIKKCEKMADAISIITDGKIKHNSTADSIKFHNLGRIISLPSGNPNALRGYSADAILIDECAFIDNPEEVYQSIIPTITRNKKAQLIIVSTPAGKNNFFYKLLEEANEDWYIQTTTIEDAIREGLKIDLKQIKDTVKDPDVFDQEYMCKFSNEYSSLIDTNLIDFYDGDINNDNEYIHLLGMDVGSVNDRTAFVTIKQKNDMFFVDDIVILHKAQYETQLEILKELHQKYHYSSGRIDQNGIGSALAEFATKTVSSKIIGYTWTSVNKTPAFENLRSKIFDHKIKFNSKFKELIINDFNNVKRIISETGKVRYEANRNKNGHSDITSALVLALEAVSKNITPNKTLPIIHQNLSIFGSRRNRF